MYKNLNSYVELQNVLFPYNERSCPETWIIQLGKEYKNPRDTVHLISLYKASFNKKLTLLSGLRGFTSRVEIHYNTFLM